MPDKTPLSLEVPIAHPVEAFLKNARKAYRQMFPESRKSAGRKSEEAAVSEAIKDIFRLNNCGFDDLWTLSRWRTEVSKRCSELKNPISDETITKHLTTITGSQKLLFPIHMIPAKIVETWSKERQRTHWGCVLLSLEIVRLKSPKQALRFAHRTERTIKKYLSTPI